MKGIVIAAMVAALFCGLIAYATITNRQSDEVVMNIGKDRPAEQPAKQRVAVAPIDAPGDRLHMPKTGVDVTKILWRRRAAVEKELGPGVERDDGKWRHDLAGGDFVVIVYDKGRVVGVELPTAGSGPYSSAEFDVLRTWFGLDEEAKKKPEGGLIINGRTLFFGESFTRTGPALYEGAYSDRIERQAEIEAKRNAAAETKRAAREQQLTEAARQVRISFVQTLAGGLSTTEFPFTFKLDNPDTTILVVGEGCSEKLLALLTKDIGNNMRNSTFTRIACSNGVAVSLE